MVLINVYYYIAKFTFYTSGFLTKYKSHLVSVLISVVD